MSASLPPPDLAGLPFGRVITAMVTPFREDLSVDVQGVQRLATYLVDHGSDGLIVNGTTGESATTTDHEKEMILRAVVEAVGDRATVIAGAGNNDSVHSIELARQAQKAGAHALLVVTPYYNRPPQEGLYRHFVAVAESAPLPVMLYDIPARTGTAIDSETLVRLSHHEQIVAVKDAKGDLAASSWVMSRCHLAYYSGEDMLNLPLLSIGAVGFASVVAHVVGERLAAMLAAWDAGDTTSATAFHRSLLPVYDGVFRTQGVITIKAALTQLGLPAGPVRPPLVDATEDEFARLVLDLADGAVEGFAA